ncbi:protein LRATD2-like [Petromyzon marinus]|uniref:LRAT domain containing 2a n=1 Tax=Petromyzon marinus TaxID=7757 RepID=S4S0V9_PETMA|nr:protein LRATD2-like [Petromyzon marinus]
MGNQVERLTHLTYNELPTADPTGLDADLGSQIGVSYIFSDEEEHVEEGGISTEDTNTAAHDDGGGGNDDIEYMVYHNEKCIFSKRRTCTNLRTYLPDVLAARCKAGDLVEFVRALKQPHWAVWVGNGQVVHLCNQEIKRETLALASRGWRGRVVSDWYRFKPLEVELVVQNACKHVGPSRGVADARWHTSEGFAAWCRYERREFKSGGEIRIGKQPYALKVYLEEEPIVMSFQSLEDVIGERRKRDKQGKGALLQELRQEL